jgi:hypothetical protein
MESQRRWTFFAVRTTECRGKLRLKVDATKQVLEARVGAQGIEDSFQLPIMTDSLRSGGHAALQFFNPV